MIIRVEINMWGKIINRDRYRWMSALPHIYIKYHCKRDLCMIDMGIVLSKLGNIASNRLGQEWRRIKGISRLEGDWIWVGLWIFILGWGLMIKVWFWRKGRYRNLRRLLISFLRKKTYLWLHNRRYCLRVNWRVKKMFDFEFFTVFFIN
jgi:hypothetical protein